MTYQIIIGHSLRWIFCNTPYNQRVYITYCCGWVWMSPVEKVGLQFLNPIKANNFDSISTPGFWNCLPRTVMFIMFSLINAKHKPRRQNIKYHNNINTKWHEHTRNNLAGMDKQPQECTKTQNWWLETQKQIFRTVQKLKEMINRRCSKSISFNTHTIKTCKPHHISKTDENDQVNKKKVG